MFVSKPEHRDRNIKQAVTVSARAAVLTTHDGSHEPAVAIFGLFRVQGVLPVADALRVANEIADAITAHRTGPHN